MTETALLAALPAVETAAPENVGRYVCHFGDVRTGFLEGDLPASGLSWTSELRETGSLSAAVPASPEASGLWDGLKAGPALVAVEWQRAFGRRILWASPVVLRGLDANAMSVGGSGMLGHLGKRLLLPDVPFDQIPTAPGMTFTGDMGTIMAKALAQVLSLDEGDLPIVLEAYRAGTRTQTYYGYEMASVAQRIDELSKHIGGPDFALLPRFADGPDYTHIVWDFITGTETAPTLNTTDGLPLVIDGTASGQNTVRGMSWAESTGDTGTHFYATGAGSEAAAMIRGAVDTGLTSQGWPRMDVTESNDSGDAVEVQAYADGVKARRNRAMRDISVDVDAQFWWSQDARLGDSVRVMFDHPIAGRIDVTSRLLSESGDVSTDRVALKLADTLAED